MRHIIHQILKESILTERIGSKRAKDTDLIYRDANMVVVVPLSFESNKSFSRGTQYCTGGDCGDHEEVDMQNAYKEHTEKGDNLYRFIFKDGTKVRLAWDGNIEAKDFHWGLGKKNEYPYFTSSNMTNPFDLKSVGEVRKKQLKIKAKKEPKEREFKDWERKFLAKWGAENEFQLDEKLLEKYKRRYPKMSDWNISQQDDYRAEERKIMKKYDDKQDEILGEYRYTSPWWTDAHEELYHAINRIPNEAITKMVEYAVDTIKARPVKEEPPAEEYTYPSFRASAIKTIYNPFYGDEEEDSGI